MENLHVPSERVALVKNSSGPVAFSLCELCKEHTEKEVSRKNNEGNGYGVRAVGTPLMVLATSSPGLFPQKWVGREKALASAGHVYSLNIPEKLIYMQPAGFALTEGSNNGK